MFLHLTASVARSTVVSIQFLFHFIESNNSRNNSRLLLCNVIKYYYGNEGNFILVFNIFED